MVSDNDKEGENYVGSKAKGRYFFLLRLNALELNIYSSDVFLYYIMERIKTQGNIYDR